MYKGYPVHGKCALNEDFRHARMLKNLYCGCDKDAAAKDIVLY